MSEVRKAQIKLNMAKAKEQHKTSIKSMTDRLKRAGNKPVTELNKYTLAQYQMKAAPDLATRSMDQGSGIKGYATDKNRKKILNRVVGIGKAANKLTQKTNEENIDEVSRETLGSYVSKASDASKHRGLPTKKVDNRYSGVAKASKRLDKMEKGSVSELKTPTLKSYISKASKDIEQKQSGKGFPFGTGKDRSKIIKRDLAIDKAKGRLSMNRQLGRAEESVQEDKDLETVIKDLRTQINEDGHTDVASARRKAVLILEDASQLYMKLKAMPEEAGLPSWWMNKMAVTAAYMDSMRNYLLVPSSDNPSMGTMPESYSMASSDTNSADKFKKKVIPQQVQEKKKKKKAKLVPMGPTSFGTGSYTDSGGGDASVGEENDAEKMKNIDKNMKVLRKMKPLKSMLGSEGPGMKKVRAKTDAISSTDKAGRSSRSRLISKYGKNINFGK